MLLFSNSVFCQFDRLDIRKLKIVDDEFLIDKDLYDFRPNSLCDCIIEDFKFLGDTDFGGSDFTVLNAGLMVEANKRAVLKSWYNKQRVLIKGKIEGFYHQNFNNFNEAVDKTFIDFGKNNHQNFFDFDKNVFNLKKRHNTTNKSYVKRNNLNIRELHHLNYRKQEILRGNINNSIFTFSEIYGGVKLKDIKNLNGINTNWNVIKSFLDTNLPTEQNAKYHSEELGNLDKKFDNFMLGLQRKFYHEELNPGQRLFLEQFSINILKVLRANPKAFSSGPIKYNVNLNLPNDLIKGLFVPVGSEAVLQNYLWGYSKRSVFDPYYYLKVLDEILVDNGMQAVYGDVNKINRYLRSKYINIAVAQATQRRNDAFNNLINSSTTEDILTDLFITALGERNNAFLDARPRLREEVEKYFKANNRSQVSHNAINYLLNQYQDNSVFPIDTSLFKSKSAPLFQDRGNLNRAILIDFIPQAVTEGITNFGNVLAELLRGNSHPSFEGSLVRTIFTANGLNIHNSILNDWFGFNFKFIPTNGNTIQINFDNGNNGYGETSLKNWFLDTDNDGYHAKGSSPKQLENSPGIGWVEGTSQGEDCDDTNPIFTTRCCDSNSNPQPFGYKGNDGARVDISLNNGILQYSNNISDDLKTLIDLANQTCSITLKNQILETSKSLTEIEVDITDEYSDCCFGKHQPYDENGNLLDWVGGNYGDFDGVPEYSCDNVGTYKRAKITIFKKNLEDSQTASGTGNSQLYGFNLSLVQSMLATFSHESHHNTDEMFIQDLRNRRSGDPDDNIGAHDAIDSREQTIWNELSNCI